MLALHRLITLVQPQEGNVMRNFWGMIAALAALALVGCKDTGTKPATGAAPTAAAPTTAEPQKGADKATPVSLLVLVSGMETWIGNETYVEDEADKVAGNFAALGPAIEQLAAIGSPGSEAAVFSYGHATDVRRGAFADISTLKATVLGTQKDYANNTAPGLRAGLAAAGKELAARAGKRRILVVLSDGNDLDPAADATLPAEIDALAAAGIELYTVCLRTNTDAMEPQCDRLTTIGKHGSFRPASAAELGAAITKLVAQIAART